MTQSEMIHSWKDTMLTKDLMNLFNISKNKLVTIEPKMFSIHSEMTMLTKMLPLGIKT